MHIQLNGDIKKDGTIRHTVNISKQYIPGFRSTELINYALISWVPLRPAGVLCH